MVKLHCTTLGVRVPPRAWNCSGGRRPASLGVEQRLRDAKIAEIYDGTTRCRACWSRGTSV